MEKEKTAYIVRWHDNMVDADVEPVKILREGVLPGCVYPTMDIQSRDGERDVCQSVLIYATEAEAWTSVKKWIENDIEAMEAQALIIKKRLRLSQDSLERINMKLIKLAVKKLFKMKNN